MIVPDSKLKKLIELHNTRKYMLRRSSLSSVGIIEKVYSLFSIIILGSILFWVLFSGISSGILFNGVYIGFIVFLLLGVISVINWFNNILLEKVRYIEDPTFVVTKGFKILQEDKVGSEYSLNLFIDLCNTTFDVVLSGEEYDELKNSGFISLFTVYSSYKAKELLDKNEKLNSKFIIEVFSGYCENTSYTVIEDSSITSIENAKIISDSYKSFDSVNKPIINLNKDSVNFSKQKKLKEFNNLKYKQIYFGDDDILKFFSYKEKYESIDMCQLIFVLLMGSVSVIALLLVMFVVIIDFKFPDSLLVVLFLFLFVFIFGYFFIYLPLSSYWWVKNGLGKEYNSLVNKDCTILEIRPDELKEELVSYKDDNDTLCYRYDKYVIIDKLNLKLEIGLESFEYLASADVGKMSIIVSLNEEEVNRYLREGLSFKDKVILYRVAEYYNGSKYKKLVL